MSDILNLANIPAPTLIEELDYETILSDKLARLHEAVPDYQLLESDPAYKLLEIVAYDELILRQRVNDAARGLMLAFAVGSDLEQIGARYDVGRLDKETDERLRTRIQQGYHLLASAGPANAYQQHAMAVSNDVVDVSVISNIPGQVTVSILASQIIESQDASADEISNGQVLFDQSAAGASQVAIVARNDSALLADIRTTLNAEDVRPLTDEVLVKAPSLVTFSIDAVLTIYQGPDSAVVEAEANQRLTDYLGSIRKLGFDATRSGLIAALTASGVQNVALNSPSDNVAITATELVVPIAVNITVGGIDD